MHLSILSWVLLIDFDFFYIQMCQQLLDFIYNNSKTLDENWKHKTTLFILIHFIWKLDIVWCALFSDICALSFYFSNENYKIILRKEFIFDRFKFKKWSFWWSSLCVYVKLSQMAVQEFPRVCQFLFKSLFLIHNSLDSEFSSLNGAHFNEINKLRPEVLLIIIVFFPFQFSHKFIF